MKQVGYYHVFPFQEIEQGSSVIIWGMGEVGQHYLKQVLQTGYCQIEFAVDRDWQKCDRSLAKVMPPFAVRRAPKETAIVIASGNAQIAGEVRQQLLDWGIADERIVWNDIIIGESMVVSDAPTQQAPKVKRIGFYHIFPFHRIEKGETLLLWGMGEVGRHYALQLQKTGYAQVEYAVDSNWQGVKDAPVDVRAPGQLAKSKNMKIVIANGSGQAADSIKAKLKDMGIDDARILWDDMIVNSELVVQEKFQQNKAGIPYKYGSESEISSRSKAIPLGINMSYYDVISFSIFDVLVFRCIKDKNAFYELVGEKIGCKDFSTIRIEAEKKAREELDGKFEFRDVSLEDIYKVIKKQTGIDVEFGCAMEVETELEWCIPNPFFREVYDVLLHNKKKIIFLEDTCLCNKFLEKILAKCGYKTEAEDIYASCECYATKRDDGSLFQLAINELGKDKRYCHVGHFYVVDNDIARQRGFRPYYYQAVHDIGNRYRAYDMSEFVGDAYRMLVNRELHQDSKTFSVPYEYGFIYGGLLALGFAQWLSRSVCSSCFDKVIFLSSDGSVIRDIYKEISHETEDSYLYWSEIIGLRMMVKRERKRFLDKVLYNVSWEKQKISVKEYFERMHLGGLISNRGRYPFHVHQEMNEKVVKAVGDFLADHWNEVQKYFENETEAAGKYVRSVVGEAKRIAIVDVNGYGETATILAEAMQERWGMRCNYEIFTIGSKREFCSPYYGTSDVGSVHAYCFDRAYQKELHKFHFGSKEDIVPMLFSLLWKNPEPELAGFIKHEDGFKFVFAEPIVENYSLVNEIKQGIKDFCHRYYSLFSEHDKLMNIFGCDAYMPFKFIASDNEYFRKNFSNYLVVDNMSVDWTCVRKLANQ